VVKKEYERLLPRESAPQPDDRADPPNPASRAGRAWPAWGDDHPGRLTPQREAPATCEA
jgi:hypothetical protein